MFVYGVNMGAYYADTADTDDTDDTDDTETDDGADLPEQIQEDEARAWAGRDYP